MKATHIIGLAGLVFSCGKGATEVNSRTTINGSGSQNDSTSSDTEFGVRNGDVVAASSDEFRSVGHLTHPVDGGTVNCSATLISSNYVLTSRACVTSDGTNNGPLVRASDIKFQPFDGTSLTSRQGSQIEIAASRQISDLALVYFSNALDPNVFYKYTSSKRYKVAFARIPDDIDLPTGIPYIAVGTGLSTSTSTPGIKRSGKLAYAGLANVTVGADRFTLDAYSSFDARNQQTCPGDAGGPLFFNNSRIDFGFDIALGTLRSRNQRFCEDVSLSFYTSLQAIRNFVRNKVPEAIVKIKPDAPTHFAIARTSRQNTLRWDASARAKSYMIIRQSFLGDRQGIGETNDLNFIDQNIVNGTYYYYFVVAKNSAGSSGYATSDIASPFQVTADATSGKISLSWTQSPDPNFGPYEISRSSSGLTGTFSTDVGSTATQTIDDTHDLIPGRTYYYRVTAYSRQVVPVGPRAAYICTSAPVVAK